LVVVIAVGVALAVVASLRDWMFPARPATPRLPVLGRDLTAFEVIEENDLEIKDVSDFVVPQGAVRDKSELVGRYALAPLRRSKLLTDGELGPKLEKDELAGKAVVGLPATPAMVLGGALKAGAFVDLVLVPGPGPWFPPPLPLTLKHVRVLDVKAVEPRVAERPGPDSPFVLVVALPADRRKAFLERGAGATYQVILDP
jgi:hypothetical protein